jgi:hypothetical protein
MNKIITIICLVTLVAGGCGKSKTGVGEVSGFVPIYTTEAQAKNIGYSTLSKATVNAGKILVLGSRLFQVETGEGIHVINIANPATPVKMGFFAVPGCQELAAKGNELFVNNYNDLVVLNSNAGVSGSPVLRRVANAFPAALNSLPLGSNVYFECPDPAKGYVSGWTRTTVKNPKCRK